MTDPLSPQVRSRLMARIKGKNTKPEVAVRKMVFSLGYRFRLHKSGLPGRPDLAFAGKRKVIFVHGCFWHGHACVNDRPPKSRRDFWGAKLRENKLRDRRNLDEIRRVGWKALVIWECELSNPTRLQTKISKYLAKDRVTRRAS